MIVISDLWKRYGDNDVLKGLSLKISDQEILVILGRSGVGKSVLLKHLIGLTKPDRGYVDVGGVRISSLKGAALYHAVRNMGMLFQGCALFDSMTVEENTAFYLKQHGDPKTLRPYTKAELKERVEGALEMVGLQEAQKKMPSELSGGMKKRAALARLIVYRPSILLYDEPTTGLDPITAMTINELIVKTQKELKGTTVVVTHDIVSALIIGDRLALHKEGKIAYLADPDTFVQIDDPEIRFLHKLISQDPRTLKYNNHNKGD
ncbi:MAG: ABC transporter ATP-binding protein [Chlamydiae bacterium GWC2_50_10]|nr:MAG: ABC transporter ATP-binding protein [Chlamydiae bacterium GWA2_50_15]OGN54229.1 MAG: ABC transporter ATP-binding protein [Chlamydiae bacterium GWC2_50_10]OGN58152.1 MAG: ABC transporter ATP-binding protein [Chlamydiae bacterium RIFCSPHIGHO2_02_FULL_49_29]OGN62398.1 MAG: ABC transporter ATP-binding protein [Chlamydiae bacterium RIFCSPHIGHO2_12_FULL_49_32]OGN67966.1 MAG: ABC transporter ATP-binding protein [Chlamydiae bacterium RIFCSPLOWO2_02_FULL_49_12]OGN74643.1 MAG: ABC transporter AT